MHPLFRIVSWKNKYNIEFKGLKEGLHEYEYKVDDKFFEHFNESLVKNGNITVKAELEKRSAFLKLQFTISGWLELICDRCLDEDQQKEYHLNHNRSGDLIAVAKPEFWFTYYNNVLYGIVYQIF